MAWAVDDNPVQIWSVGDPFPVELAHHIGAGSELHAWNAQFERHIWNGCQIPSLGWPAVDNNQWRCTAAKSRHANHPGALDSAAKMLMPDKAGKDKEGQTLMKRMAKPQKWTKKEIKDREAKFGGTLMDEELGIKWIEDPISMALLEGYCKQDVVVERELDKILPDWPEDEIKVWQLNERVNDRGVPFDREVCEASNNILVQTLSESSEKISALTDGEITTGNQIQRMKKFLSDRHMMDVDDPLDADTVEGMLRPGRVPALDEASRDILQMRQVTAGAAAKKYKAACDVISADDRGRGLFMYYGASTGRFASLKVQIQNMKHGSDKTGTFRDAVITRNMDLMHLLYEDTIVTELGKNVRSIVCAPEGHTLVRCDSSQIECRVLHWLAGNESMLQTFRDGADPYLKFASSVYNYDVQKKEKDKRQLGKAAVLGLGFGMGANRFQASVAESPYYLDITPKFAKMVVDLWRNENPLVLKFWRNLEKAAKACVTRGQSIRVGHVVIRKEGDYMTVQLPSGRRLFYYKPGFEGEGFGLRFMYTSTRGVRYEWAGGLLCENIVQAVARDTLVHYMALAEDEGLTIVAHVHDELMALVELSQAAWAEETMLKCFDTPLPWMEGLPCAAEATVWRRYAG